MPTAAAVTFSNQGLLPAFPLKGEPAQISVALPASSSFAKGTVIAEMADTPGKFDAFAHGGSNGLGNPRALLRYDCQTDSNGLITFSSTSSQSGGEHGEKAKTAPAYVEGDFYTADLTGFDSNAIADSGGAWKLIQGTNSTGIVNIG